MSHPLDSCIERIRRAEEHLSDLRARLEAFEDINRGRYVVHYDSGIDDLVMTSPATLKPPERFTVIIGEIVYNLRCALDYLIYELARKDSGADQSNTQFPIEDTEDGFNVRRRNFLKGVSGEHIARIEQLQPYKGCDWSKLVRDLSNKDKHRKLTPAVTGAHTRLRYTKPLVTQAEIEATKRGHGSLNVHVDFEISFSVAFEDRTPVVETLEKLITNVSQAIESFRDAF